MANFIPPINLGVFKPSSESLASWLYQVWQYLQENPIASEQELTEQITELLPPEIAAYLEEHPPAVESVNGLVGAVVIAYADLVDDLTVPVFRTTTAESTQGDLLTAWDEGCRFAVIDDTNVYVMLKNNNAITLLACGSGGGGGGGIQSINSTVLPDATGNATLYGSDIPLSSTDPTTVNAKCATLTNAVSGKASQSDLDLALIAINNKADNISFAGASSSEAGSMGLVPAPDIGQQKHYLTGDGNWTPPPLIYVNITFENVGNITAGTARYVAISKSDIPSGYTPVSIVASYFTFSGGTPFISGLCDTTGAGTGWFFRIYTTNGAATNITGCTIRLWLAKL